MRWDYPSKLCQAADAHTAPKERLGPPAIVLISTTGQILRRENLLDGHPHRSEEFPICTITHFRRESKSFRPLKSDLLRNPAGVAKASDSARHFYSIFMTLYLHFQDNSASYPESNFLNVTNRRTEVGATFFRRAMINFLHESSKQRNPKPFYHYCTHFRGGDLHSYSPELSGLQNKSAGRSLWMHGSRMG